MNPKILSAASVKSYNINELSTLSEFNQNTLHLCHNMLRHLPKTESPFLQVHKSPNIDRAKEIEQFLLDQSEKLVDLSGKNLKNDDYGVDIYTLDYRSEKEKRFVSLLNHFISYSERHNTKVFNTLSVKYGNGEEGVWSKEALDEFGGKLSSTNPQRLHNFLTAVANNADPNNPLEFNSPVVKAPSQTLDIKEELSKLSMGLVEGTEIEFDPNMSESDINELLSEIHTLAEALKFKENSLKLRQETLMSIYQGNPNGEVREMIVATNAMFMNLKNEQGKLKQTVEQLEEHLLVNNMNTAATSMAIDDIHETIESFSLAKNTNLSFIVSGEKLDSILNYEQPKQEFELSSQGMI